MGMEGDPGDDFPGDDFRRLRQKCVAETVRLG